MAMKAYSLDLRERVLNALDAGMPRADVVRTFQVSHATIKRWLSRRATTGSLVPAPRPGQAPRIPTDQDAHLRAQLDAHPDATLAEHAAVWNAEHQTTLSQWTLGRAIRRLNWTRKKSP
jgi:transposase